MVQAAAQAQAVVAAAKNRGGGLVPMNSAQITALSQIQAQAIVNARPQTALIGTGNAGEKPTNQQLQNQIQLQAQALVHAHTQAQISAGIYKGDGGTVSSTGAAVGAGAKRKSDSPIKQPDKTKLPPQPSTDPSSVLNVGTSQNPLKSQQPTLHPKGPISRPSTSKV